MHLGQGVCPRAAICEAVTAVAFFMPEQSAFLWKYLPSSVE